MAHEDVDARRLIWPGLAPFYEAAAPLSYALMRVALGLMLMPHGLGKLIGDDIPNTAKNFMKMGLPYPEAWAYLVGVVETFGGLMLALGLLTRIVAAAISVEMAWIVFLVLWPNYFWGQRGMEYALMMGIFAFAMALRGGGRYSLDRLIGKEF